MKPVYYIQQNIGKAKYVVSFFAGQFHNDGSQFHNIAIFRNKKKLNEFIKVLEGSGYSPK